MAEGNTQGYQPGDLKFTAGISESLQKGRTRLPGKKIGNRVLTPYWLPKTEPIRCYR